MLYEVITLLPSGHYYFNDSENRFEGNQLRYTLKKEQPDDRWFFDTLALKKPFGININKDTELGIIKVWINVQLRDQGRVTGVVGTGFDFEQFLKESVGLGQEGVHNFFIDAQGSIQLVITSYSIHYTKLYDTIGTLWQQQGERVMLTVFFRDAGVIDQL